VDVTLEGRPAAVPAQATGLKAFHRAGQTFLTWKEVSDPTAGREDIRWGEMERLLAALDREHEVRYCVYRSSRRIEAGTLSDAECIAQVRPLSCWNVNGRSSERPRDEVVAELLSDTNRVRFWVEGRKGTPDECPIDRFVIADADAKGAPGPPLEPGTGLYVHTASEKAAAYYAVVTMVDGIQNTTDFGPENSLAQPVAEAPAAPEPVLQRILQRRPVWDYRHRRCQYVQWVAPPYANLPCHYYNWLVCIPDRMEGNCPVELTLPEPGNSYYRPPYRLEQDSIVVVPHDFPLQTWYFGCHEAEGTLRSFRQGAIHNYTQRRIVLFLDWLARSWPVDRDRIAVAGTGLVAGSGALHLGLRRHDVFNIVMASYGCPDFRGAILKFRELGEVRKVPNVERTFKVKCAQAAIERLVGRLDWNLKTESGASVWDELNLTKMIQALPASTDLPVVTYAGQGGFEPERDFMLALLDRGHLLIANFNVYGMNFLIPVSRTGVLTGMIGVDVRKNLSHPAFRGPGSEVLLKPPQLATGELVVSDGTLQYWGAFNEAYRWRDVVDEPDRYEITLEWKGRGAGTSDVVLRRLQKFRVEPGRVYAWEYRTGAAGEVGQQGGEATAGEDGLLRIPRVPIAGAPGRLVVRPRQG